MKPVQAILLTILLLIPPLLIAEEKTEQKIPEQTLRKDMQSVYTAFKELHRYLFNRAAFLDDSNEKAIGGILSQLNTRFTHVEQNKDAKNDPGFSITLAITADLIEDAKRRFTEGNKEYALWRLRTASNHCVTCHTRHEVRANFSDASVDLSGWSPLDKGEFLLATRRFDEARAVLIDAAINSPVASDRFEALRRWLVLAVRVKPNVQIALSELVRVKEKGNFLLADRDEVDRWIKALAHWMNERATDLPALKKAESLIRQGIGSEDPILAQTGSVELLRATSLLHTYMEGSEAKTKKERAHALYLLGLAYSHLSQFFVEDLAALFLEQCIRENPGTEDAKRAYKVFENELLVGFGGVSGKDIPSEEKLRLKTLHDAAYGVAKFQGQI